jgi:hypothetical protein
LSGPDGPEPLPTWEQLLTGVGVRARPVWRFATATPRHVRALPVDWSMAWSADWSVDWSVDWDARWCELVRELRVDTSMSWTEAWAWAVVATACAAAASCVTGLLR